MPSITNSGTYSLSSCHAGQKCQGTWTTAFLSMGCLPFPCLCQFHKTSDLFQKTTVFHLQSQQWSDGFIVQCHPEFVPVAFLHLWEYCDSNACNWIKLDMFLTSGQQSRHLNYIKDSNLHFHSLYEHSVLLGLGLVHSAIPIPARRYFLNIIKIK